MKPIKFKLLIFTTILIFGGRSFAQDKPNLLSGTYSIRIESR